MKSAVVVFPGINRERDMARTLKLVSGTEPSMVWHADTELPAGTDLVVVPGGFSYGDYLRCGAIAARAPIMDAVRAHAGRGGLVLGVCNGFQILCESGLLPGVLMRNAAAPLHLQGRLSAGRALRHAVHPRLQRRPGDPCAGRPWRGQLRRRPRNHRRGSRARGGWRSAMSSPDGELDPRWNVNGATNAIAGILSERRQRAGADAASRRTTWKPRSARPTAAACSPG